MIELLKPRIVCLDLDIFVLNASITLIWILFPVVLVHLTITKSVRMILFELQAFIAVV